MSSLNEQEKNLILAWADDFSIELSATQADQLAIYLNELWEWNKKFNLTGLNSREKIVTELLLDSILPSPLLPERGDLLDVGSGAGFPSIPLKICRPRLKTHLLEPNSKRVSFLKHVIRLAGLKDIRVIRGRIGKDTSLLLKEGYHAVTARALADLPRTLTWCAPLIRPGGLFISFQGGAFQDSIKKSSLILNENSLCLYKTIPYLLPGKTSKRHLLLFMKQ